VGIWGSRLITRDLRDFLTVDEAARLKLQHRLVLELLLDSFTGSETGTIYKVFGQRTPTITRIHQCNLADHQHEVTEPEIFGVHAENLLSDEEPCEGFRGTL
jgi:hypothetical protein